MDAALHWLENNRELLILVVVGLLALVFLQRILGWLGRAVRSVRRRGKPVELHPRLQAYAGHSEEDLKRDLELASQVIATSSTPSVAGYTLVRQIEAVFVEGYRTPNEATTSLKATAAKRGANAIINLAHQRTAAGKCSAQGDAVVIEPIPRAPPTK
ncbi:MAG TPA: hypothetical protein VNT79_02085 [Phycisphaerae bacterium]|nr:hypothetical protein [Phycisphaerae bacterium]